MTTVKPATSLTLFVNRNLRHTYPQFLLLGPLLAFLFLQPGGMPMHSRQFSRTTKEGRGDTSAWTDSPLDRAQKAKMKYLLKPFLFFNSSFALVVLET